jgi:hypothetical protein
MKYKAGDIVRIQSREWFEAQEKDEDGFIRKDGYQPITPDMQEYAGQTAKIMKLAPCGYALDIDDENWVWEDRMFDPDYSPDEPLPAEDAIRAMLDGETLYDEDGSKYWFSGADACFSTDSESKETPGDIDYFNGLCRRPAKRERLMTQDEARTWAESEDSLGWMVRYSNIGSWTFPRGCKFGADIGNYNRARPLHDLSGIDESTVEGFEAEE